MSDSPDQLKGGAIGRGEFRSNARLPNAFRCLFKPDNDLIRVECIWLARGYARSLETFATISTIVQECGLLTELGPAVTKPDGNQERSGAYEVDKSDNRITVEVRNETTIEYSSRASRQVVFGMWRIVN